MVAVLVASQGLRWWCITTLGKRWNTRVIILPEAPLVQGGPYRLFHHPNYVAVVAEGFALPLVHTAWLTALCFHGGQRDPADGAYPGRELRIGLRMSPPKILTPTC